MGQITKMGEEHLQELWQLEQECFSMPWSKEALRQELENPLAHYFVYVENGHAAGYIGLHIILDEGHITNIAVAKNMRRQGVGHRLMAAVLEEAKQKKLSFLELELRPSNLAAMHLYQKVGFVLVGRRPGYYEQPTEDALLMTLFLTENQVESETIEQ